MNLHAKIFFLGKEKKFYLHLMTNYYNTVYSSTR